MAQFNDRIRDLRKENNFTQKSLGEKMGVAGSQVRKWEITDSYANVPKLIELSKIFNVSTDYILGLTDDKNFGKHKQKELSDYSTDELMKEVLRRWS